MFTFLRNQLRPKNSYYAWIIVDRTGVPVNIDEGGSNSDFYGALGQIWTDRDLADMTKQQFEAVLQKELFIVSVKVNLPEFLPNAPSFMAIA